MTHPEPKINLKTITAHQVLSHREKMCELFQLLDDSKRHELIIGTVEQRERRLDEFRQRRDALRRELGK
ncbi:AaceriAEL046Wp [[Ashbya] aceris (nom. inval.)]|nr:AaceriAEL046Wp [[Ashbya] aceris (nom. inval.)]